MLASGPQRRLRLRQRRSTGRPPPGDLRPWPRPTSLVCARDLPPARVLRPPPAPEDLGRPKEEAVGRLPAPRRPRGREDASFCVAASARRPPSVHATFQSDFCRRRSILAASMAAAPRAGRGERGSAASASCSSAVDLGPVEGREERSRGEERLALREAVPPRPAESEEPLHSGSRGNIPF